MKFCAEVFPSQLHLSYSKTKRSRHWTTYIYERECCLIMYKAYFIEKMLTYSLLQFNFNFKFVFSFYTNVAQWKYNPLAVIVFMFFFAFVIEQKKKKKSKEVLWLYDVYFQLKYLLQSFFYHFFALCSVVDKP